MPCLLRCLTSPTRAVRSSDLITSIVNYRDTSGWIHPYILYVEHKTLLSVHATPTCAVQAVFVVMLDRPKRAMRSSDLDRWMVNCSYLSGSIHRYRLYVEHTNPSVHAALLHCENKITAHNCLIFKQACHQCFKAFHQCGTAFHQCGKAFHQCCTALDQVGKAFHQFFTSIVKHDAVHKSVMWRCPSVQRISVLVTLPILDTLIANNLWYDDVFFYNSTASVWTLATSRTSWESNDMVEISWNTRIELCDSLAKVCSLELRPEVFSPWWLNTQATAFSAAFSSRIQNSKSRRDVDSVCKRARGLQPVVSSSELNKLFLRHVDPMNIILYILLQYTYVFFS